MPDTIPQTLGSGRFNGILMGILMVLFLAAPAIVEARPEKPQVAAQWPAGADGTRMLAGVFYGSDAIGVLTGNAVMGTKFNNRRFRAERSGFIDAVMYNNRILSAGNIADRCAKKGPGWDRFWCPCVNAKLTALQCSYTLSGSYSAGNGGLQIQEIRRDNGNGFPDMSSAGLLARTDAYVPLDTNPNTHIVLALRSPARLQAGELYHMLMNNLKPPTTCAVRNVPVSQASRCRDDEGAQGLNGLVWPKTFGSGPTQGPFRGTSGANMKKDDPSEGWYVDPDTLSRYGVRYTDGMWAGDMVSAYDLIFDAKGGDGSNAEKVIQGSTRARQVFVKHEGTETVTGVWVYHGHYDKQANGSSMTVELRDGSGSRGTVLATGTIPYNSACNNISNQPGWTNRGCRVWEYTTLSSPVSLTDGSPYRLEFSAPDGAAFSMSAAFDFSYTNSSFGTNPRFWGNPGGVTGISTRGVSYDEVSTNSGSSWGDWVGSYYRARDLSVVFTKQGGPLMIDYDP